MNPVERIMHALPQGADAAIVTSRQNRRYLTGFSSSAGTLLLTREKAYFIIDFRYIEAARAGVRGCEVLLQERLGEQLGALLSRHGVRTVYTETSYLTLAEFSRLKELLLPAALSENPDFDAALLRQRRYKTPDEVACIRTAQRYTDETFSHILNFIRPGRTEREIALEMEFHMRSLGAEGVSFDFIVASGENSSRPHAVPGQRAVCAGDFITMDFGGIVDGYCSDMTRTVAVGPDSALTQEQRRVYNTVLEAQLAGLAAITLGATGREVDAAARDIIDAAGYKGCFGHSLGHSLGVEIHEEPRFAESSKDVVEPGVVMTVEPGVYLEGRFGCRIEDMVYVTQNTVENLTASPKNLMVL